MDPRLDSGTNAPTRSELDEEISNVKIQFKSQSRSYAVPYEEKVAKFKGTKGPDVRLPTFFWSGV